MPIYSVTKDSLMSIRTGKYRIGFTYKNMENCQTLT